MGEHYLLLTDETNIHPSEKVRFFIYGAAIVPLTAAHDIHEGIRRLRERYRYTADHDLKFDTRAPKPDWVTPARFRDLKNSVLELAHAHGVRFIVQIAHHDIIGGDTRRVFLYALKTLVCQFDLFLERTDSHGLCLCDRFTNDFEVLTELFVKGFDPHEDGYGFTARLNRVWLCGTTASKCSHLSSMVDIVLGAFRFCVNETDKDDVCRVLYKKVHALTLRSPTEPSVVEEWGILYRPTRVLVPQYREQYDQLRDRLRRLALEPEVGAGTGSDLPF